MANSKKFVAKNGLETQNIQFVEQDGTETITLTVLEDGTLSFSGSSGQLFSIADSLTGSIFSVNDISGIPSIEVFDDGKIVLAESAGNVLIGTATDDGVNKLQVAGNIAVTGTVDGVDVAALKTLTDSIVDGSQGLVDARITNSATDVIPLIVNGNISTTADLQKWQVNGSDRMSLSTNSVLNIGGGNVVIQGNNGNVISYGNIIGTNFRAVGSAEAALMTMSTGTTISRNVNDTNPTLIVRKIQGTGNILELQSGTSDKKLEVDVNGWLYQNGTRLFHQTADTTNTFLGNEVANLTLSGTSSVAIGRQAFQNATTANSITAIGHRAFRNNTTGSRGVAVGLNAGLSLTTGQNSTFLGTEAGNNASQLVSATNSTALGFEAYTDKSNQMVFGNASVTEFKFDRNASAVALLPRVEISSVDFPPLSVQRTSSLTTGLGASIRLLRTTSSNMTDGFGVLQHFAIQDSSNVINTISEIGAERSGADNSGRLFFSTNNTGSLTEKMTILPNGNVGIGTGSPTNLLHIVGGNSVSLVNIVGASSGIQLGADAEGASIRPSLVDALNFRRTNGAIAMNINSGLVGIGETSPSAQLQVKSGATNRVPLTIDTVSGNDRSLQEWKKDGALTAVVRNDGRFAAIGIGNIDSFERAGINTSFDGVVISRNQADTNPALKVNLVNAGATGNIVEFQKEGTTVASINGTGDITGRNLNLSGDLIVSGSTITLDTQTVTIEDNIILINSSQTGTPSTLLEGGIEVERGDETNYKFAFVEATDDFRIGQVGDLQAVATREDAPIDTAFSYWNNAANRFDTTNLIQFNFNSGSSRIDLGRTLLKDNNNFTIGDGSDGRIYSNGTLSYAEIDEITANNIAVTNTITITAAKTADDPLLRLVSTGVGDGDAVIELEANEDGEAGIVFKNPDNTNNAGWFLGYGDAYGESFYLYDRQNITPRINVLHNGNVGIGTATPAKKLDIENSLEMFKTGTDSAVIQSVGDILIVTDRDNNYNGNAIRFMANGDGPSATEIMRIADAGNVGIGTTTPTEKLDILGNTRVQGNIILDGTATTTNQNRTISFTGFDKEGTTDFSDAAFIRHTTNTGGHSGSVLEISSQNDTTDGVAFTTNSSSQVRHNGHIMWDAGNDGSGSGLDADTLDGFHASNFVPYDETFMPTNPFGGKKLYINSIDNAMHAADKKWYVTATLHSKVYNSENYPMLNPVYRDIYTYTTSDNTIFTLDQTPLPSNVVIYFTISGGGTMATQVASSPANNTQYTYDNSTGIITFGAARLDSTIYVYPHPDVVQYLDSPVVSTVSSSTFFDGGYEGGRTVTTSQYLKVRVAPGDNSTTPFTGSVGYPYGTLYLSHYYDGAPEIEYLRTYNYSYAAHGIGWKQATFADYVNNKNHPNYISSVTNGLDFGRSVMEFIVISKSDKNASLVEIDWKLSRPNLQQTGSTVTKFGENKLYSLLRFGNQVDRLQISENGWIRASDNNASFPAYSFINDSNTGMFRPADDTLAFAEGGVEVMRINSSGNVGIGTTSPTDKLHIDFPTAGGDAIVKSGNVIGKIGASENAPGVYIGSRSNNNLFLQTNNSTRMTINTSGNVGIGTSSPGVPLEVNGRILGASLSVGTNSTRSKILLYGGSSDYTIGMQDNITYGGFNNDWGMTFQFNNDNDRGFWWGDSAHTQAQGAMALTTNGLLTVASGIRVGYGESDTTIPSAGLDVSGNISVTGTVDGVDIAALSTTVDGKLNLTGGTLTGDLTIYNSNLLINSEGPNIHPTIRLFEGGTLGGVIKYNESVNKLYIGTNNGSGDLDTITLLRDGSAVGINETTPTAQLQVKSGATNRVPLIVDTLSDQTASLAEFKVNNSNVVRITTSGVLLTGGNNVYFQASGGGGLRGNQLNNGVFRFDDVTGSPIITRGQTDDIPALRVSQSNASSTGDILKLQKAGADVYAFTHDGTLKAPSIFTIDPSAHGDATGKVIILGDLQVDGTTTTINSTTLDVNDKNITLSKGATNKAASDGAGISIDLGTDGTADFTYGATADRFIINKGLEIGANTITGNTTGANLKLNTSVGSMLSYNTNSVQVLNAEIRVNTGNTERMRVTSTGDVGIGTTTPSSKLHVLSTASVRTITETTASTGNVYASTDMKNTSRTYSLGIGGAGETAHGVANKFYLYDSVLNGMRMVVDTNGNVGIGTTTPSEKLDVVGNIKHTGLVMTDGTNVDQLKTTTFTSALTTAWTDVTGVSGTYLSTGSYIVQIESNGEYYTGNISWFSGSTTTTVADEIVLHRAGPAASAARIYARVLRESSGTLKLQVSASTSVSSHTLTFKFRRTI